MMNWVTLTLYNENQKIAEQLVDLNSRTSIDLRGIKGELFIADVVNENGNLIASAKVLQKYMPDQEAKIIMKETYSNRTVVNLQGNLNPGSYSISVRKKDGRLRQFHNPASLSGWLSRVAISPVELDVYFSSAGSSELGNILYGSGLKKIRSRTNLKYLPEFRHEFLDGRLISQEERLMAGEVVALTTFSEPFMIQTAKTDSVGNFSIPFESLEQNTEAMVTPIALDSTMSIDLHKPFIETFTDLHYRLDPLDSAQVREVIAKSVRIQLENAYFTTADSVVIPEADFVSQFNFNKSYTLDEYTRFNSLQETFVEYIPEASVRGRRNPKIKPHFNNVPEQIKQQPLILLDGVPVSADNLLAFSASNIEQINLLNNRYFLGPLIADGVINFKTFEGKMGRYPRRNYHYSTTILGLKTGSPLSTSEEFNDLKSNLPDQRDQLYWNPIISVKADNKQDWQFMTSDVSGKFEVVIEGYQFDGKPVSISKTFMVNPPKP